MRITCKFELMLVFQYANRHAGLETTVQSDTRWLQIGTRCMQTGTLCMQIRHAMHANRHVKHENRHESHIYIQPFVLWLVASGMQWTVSNLTVSLAFRIGGTPFQASVSLPSKFGRNCMVTPLKGYYDLSTELTPIGPTLLEAPSLKLGKVSVLRLYKRHCIEART